jgi:hypothetical protein
LAIVPLLLPDFRLIYFRIKATGFSSLYQATTHLLLLFYCRPSFNVLIIIQEKRQTGDSQQCPIFLFLQPAAVSTFHLAASLPSTIFYLLHVAEDILDVKFISLLQNE